MMKTVMKVSLETLVKIDYSHHSNLIVKLVFPLIFLKITTSS
jgi:hypothetical protein